MKYLLLGLIVFAFTGCSNSNKCKRFYTYSSKTINIKGITVKLQKNGVPVENTIGEINIDPKNVVASEEMQKLDFAQYNLCSRIHELPKDDTIRRSLQIQWINSLLDLYKMTKNPDSVLSRKVVKLEAAEQKRLVEDSIVFENTLTLLKNQYPEVILNAANALALRPSVLTEKELIALIIIYNNNPYEQTIKDILASVIAKSNSELAKEFFVNQFEMGQFFEGKLYKYVRKPWFYPNTKVYIKCIAWAEFKRQALEQIIDFNVNDTAMIDSVLNSKEITYILSKWLNKDNIEYLRYVLDGNSAHVRNEVYKTSHLFKNLLSLE
jgi:hypothetical protein